MRELWPERGAWFGRTENLEDPPRTGPARPEQMQGQEKRRDVEKEHYYLPACLAKGGFLGGDSFDEGKEAAVTEAMPKKRPKIIIWEKSVLLNMSVLLDGY